MSLHVYAAWRPTLLDKKPRVITFSGDLPPGRRWVHEGGVLYLFVDVLVLVEGEGARQRHVYDHAHRPHVQRPVVSFVAQHFWSYTTIFTIR